MVCPKCYGMGWACIAGKMHSKPCPECQGSGIVSCCDTAGAAAAAYQAHEYMKPEDYWADVENALPSAVSK
jgi:RecJ-like exonuclease